MLKLSNGRVSKTKIAAVVSTLLGVLIAFNVIELGPAQRDAVELLAVAAIGLFLRDGIDEAG